MRSHWRWILPVFGLLLFLGETYGSLRLNRELKSRNHYRKDFWWGTFRLRTDPLGKVAPQPCPTEELNCAGWWEVRDVIVDPGLVLETLLISGFPAFLISVKTVHGLARLGVNEVHSFFVVTPLLVLGWYFLLGWLLDLWITRRKRKAAAAN